MLPLREKEKALILNNASYFEPYLGLIKFTIFTEIEPKFRYLLPEDQYSKDKS